MRWRKYKHLTSTISQTPKTLSEKKIIFSTGKMGYPPLPNAPQGVLYVLKYSTDKAIVGAEEITKKCTLEKKIGYYVPWLQLDILGSGAEVSCAPV